LRQDGVGVSEDEVFRSGLRRDAYRGGGTRRVEDARVGAGGFRGFRGGVILLVLVLDDLSLDRYRVVRMYYA
jgi:hypothetical protein